MLETLLNAAKTLSKNTGYRLDLIQDGISYLTPNERNLICLAQIDFHDFLYDTRKENHEKNNIEIAIEKAINRWF